MASVLLSLGYALSWGVGQTLSKIALTEISPSTLLIVQLGSSVAFLALLYGTLYQRFPFSLRSIKQGGAGVFEPALAYMLGVFGLSLTTASAASLIGASEVVLTVMFAALFLREPLTRKLLLLAVSSFAGVSLLFVDGGGSGDVSATGNLLVLAGTLFAVVYVLYSKKAVGGTNPLQLTAAQQLVGFVTTLLCFGALALVRSDFALVTTGVPLPFWLLAVVAGVMQYALGFLFYLIALRGMPVSRAAFYVALVPVFGVGSAALLLGEAPGAAQWLGAAFIIGSSYFANRERPAGERAVADD